MKYLVQCILLVILYHYGSLAYGDSATYRPTTTHQLGVNCDKYVSEPAHIVSTAATSGHASCSDGLSSTDPVGAVTGVSYDAGTLKITCQRVACRFIAGTSVSNLYIVKDDPFPS